MEAHLARMLLVLITLPKMMVTTPTAMVFEKVYFHEVILVPLFPSNDTIIYQTLTQISIQTCIDECKRLRLCDFINFHVRKHQCDMIRSDSNANVLIVSSRGNAYSIKADWDLNEVILGCSTCAITERCGFETNPTACKVEACDPPSFVPGTVLYGNMLRTGDSILYQCNDNKTMSQGSIFKSTCQNDGLWSVVNVTCTEGSADGSTSSCESVYLDTFQTIVLSDNTEFAYLIVTAQMDQSTALTYCEDRCGQLVGVLTSVKYKFLRDLLESHPVYSGNNMDYWINGNYDSSTGKWMTSSGIEIQHTYSIWESNPTFFSSSQSCIKMRQHARYKINTNQCSDTYGAICEQP